MNEISEEGGPGLECGLSLTEMLFAIDCVVRFKNAALRQIVDARMNKFCYYSYGFWGHLVWHDRTDVRGVENSASSL